MAQHQQICPLMFPKIYLLMYLLMYLMMGIGAYFVYRYLSTGSLVL